MDPLLILVLIFAPVAGLMAFLITYEEYSHHLPDKRAVLRVSLEAGVAAALFLGGLSGVAYWLIRTATR